MAGFRPAGALARTSRPSAVRNVTTARYVPVANRESRSSRGGDHGRPTTVPVTRSPYRASHTPRNQPHAPTAAQISPVTTPAASYMVPARHRTVTRPRPAGRGLRVLREVRQDPAEQRRSAYRAVAEFLGELPDRAASAPHRAGHDRLLLALAGEAP